MQQLREEDIIQLIKAEMSKIDDTELLFELRKLRFKRIIPNKQSFHQLKAAIALTKLGLPITVYTTSSITGVEHPNALRCLHLLGDKRLLTLMRRATDRHGGGYQWVASELLRKVMEAV